MSSGERFEYRGYECIRNYQGHWTIYKLGANSSTDTAPSDKDAKRKIDKWLRED